MINIEDTLIQFLPKISDKSFKTYVILKRYFTEKLPLPIDKLPKILSLDNFDQLFPLLEELEQVSLIKFSRTTKNSCPIFLIHDKLSSSVIMISHSAVPPLHLNGEVARSKVKLLETLVSDFNKPDYSSQLTQMIEGLESKASKQDFERVFSKIEKKKNTFLAEYITNTFSDILIRNSKYKLKLTSKWRMFQLSSARALVKDYPSFEKEDWDDVLDFFLNPESYWGDKTDSVKFMRIRMVKYFAAKNKENPSKNALSSNMEIIE